MRRRVFITGLGCTALWATVARAQHTAIPVIGFLGSESPALFENALLLFREGLRGTGYIEGQNVAIEYRWAEGHNDRLPALAAELVHRRVRVIAVPGTTPGALAAKAATTTIPIVFFTAGDPVALRLVASLNRPGGNLTGVTSIGSELAPKRLELLHQVVPKASVFAGLVNPTNPALAESNARELQGAAQSLGVRLQILQAGSERDFDDVFRDVLGLRAGGLVITIDSFFTARRQQLGALALRHGVPAIYQHRDFAAAGGLMTYGASLNEGYRLAGIYTGRILKGEKASNLPVEQVKKVELIVNMKAAKALELNVPRSLLLRADEIIE